MSIDRVKRNSSHQLQSRAKVTRRTNSFRGRIALFYREQSVALSEQQSLDAYGTHPPRAHVTLPAPVPDDAASLFG